MKVLFCSPYSDSPNTIKGGINTWGKYIIEYYERYGKEQVELIPVSLDRSVFAVATASFLGRIRNGCRDQIRAVRRAIQLMDSEKIDVAHICTSAGLGVIRDYILVRAAKKRDVKAVVHLHFGRIPALARQRNWEWILLVRVLRMCNIPVVMNRSSEKTLVDEGFMNVVYLPNPLGISVLDEIKEASGKYKRVPRRLLYCGHVLKTKGVMELVEGCSHIPNIELRIVGKCMPDIKEELLSLAQKTVADTSWLNFVGEVSHEDVIREFFEADLFVFPSYSEGFPNVIMEAMACSCPIVSSNVGAIPEILDVSGDACGVCFKSQSADEVFKAVSSLIDDNARKANYATKARERVNSHYAISQIWMQIVCIWHNAKRKRPNMTSCSE